MEKSYVTSIGTLECFKEYAISRICSEIISKEGANELLKLSYQHYRNRKFVLISERNDSYQVDPSAYRFINPKKIIGIALVSKNNRVRLDAIEKQRLYPGAFSYFSTVEEAVDWANTVVKKN